MDCFFSALRAYIAECAAGIPRASDFAGRAPKTPPHFLEVFMIIGRNRLAQGQHLLESVISRLATYVLIHLTERIGGGRDRVLNDLE
jgi:hypothetical protein